MNQRSEDPWRDLFLWAVLQNRHEMATTSGPWCARRAGGGAGVQGVLGGCWEACGGWEVAAHLGPGLPGPGEGVAALWPPARYSKRCPTWRRRPRWAGLLREAKYEQLALGEHGVGTGGGAGCPVGTSPRLGRPSRDTQGEGHPHVPTERPPCPDRGGPHVPDREAGWGRASLSQPPGRWAQAHSPSCRSSSAGRRRSGLGVTPVACPTEPLLPVLPPQRGARLRPAGASEPLLEQNHLPAPGHRGRHQGLLCP